MTQAGAASYSVDGLADRRIVVVATGALGAAFLHSWLGWFTTVSPSTQVRVVVTPAARRFVTLGTLHALGHEPIVDDWDEHPYRPVHVELGQWAEGFLVHPATMDFVSRLSAGLCDSPVLLALQGSTAPTVVAASAPPGFTSSPVWSDYVEALKRRPHVALLPPMTGHSVSSAELEGLPPTIFPAAMQTLGRMLTGGQE